MCEFVGDGSLVHQSPGFCPGFGKEQDLVALAAHDAGTADIVGDDPVAFFACPFRLGIGFEIFRLRGEADDQARPLRSGCGKPGQNVGIFA